MPTPEPVQHADQSGINLHSIARWIFFDASERDADGTYTDADLHKIAYEQSTQTYWGLVDLSNPGASATPIWAALGGGNAGIQINEEGEAGATVSSIEVAGAGVSFPNVGQALIEISRGTRARIAPDGNDTIIWLLGDETGATGPFVNSGTSGASFNLSGDSENLAIETQRIGIVSPLAIRGLGNGNFIEVANSIELPEFTFALWYRPAPNPETGQNVIIEVLTSFSAPQNFIARIAIEQASGALTGTLNKESSAGTLSISAPKGFGYADGQWHHLGLTYEQGGGGLRLYLDGDLVALDTSFTGAPQTGGSRIRVARNYGGYLQDIRIRTAARGASYFRDAWKAGMLIP